METDKERKTMEAKKRTGLVLEGGAMRGLFTAGVLDVWMEAGVAMDVVAGVSAGAAFGCNFLSGQAGRVLRYNTRFCRDWRYCSLRSLLKTGDLYGADFCYRELPDVLDPFDRAAFNRSPMAFYAVCTDLETGQAVYQPCPRADGEAFAYMRASASMPLVSRPVQIGGRLLMDGGIADSIPFAWMQKQGVDRIVAVLTRPRAYEKKRQRGAALLLRRYPAAREMLKTRAERYNESRRQVFAAEKAGGCFVICPQDDLPVGHVEHSEERLRRAYALGAEQARETLSALRAYLA